MNFIRLKNIKTIIPTVGLTILSLFIFFSVVENSHSNLIAQQINQSLQYPLAKSDSTALFNNLSLYSAFDNIGCLRLIKNNETIMFLKSSDCSKLFSKTYTASSLSNNEFSLSFNVFPSLATKIQVLILSLIIIALFLLVLNLLENRRVLLYKEQFDKMQNELVQWMNSSEEKSLVCRQIYHDLSSPLALLKITTQKLMDQNIAKAFTLSLDRIMKIAEDLQSQKYIWSSECPQLEPIAKTAESIINEKKFLTDNLKIQYILKISKNSYDRVPDIPVGQLHRVLSNILNNAIDAIKPVGKIKLILRYRTNNSFLDLLIADSGPGISNLLAPHIFEKNRTFNKLNGTGLGLYHAKTCIESFGGTIILLNTNKDRGHGACFLIRLPCIHV